MGQGTFNGWSCSTALATTSSSGAPGCASGGAATAGAAGAGPSVDAGARRVGVMRLRLRGAAAMGALGRSEPPVVLAVLV